MTQTERTIKEEVVKTIITTTCDICGKTLNSYDRCPLCERYYCRGDYWYEKSRCYDGDGMPEKEKDELLGTMHIGYPCKTCRDHMGDWFPAIKKLSHKIDECVDAQHRLIKEWKKTSLRKHEGEP